MPHTHSLRVYYEDTDAAGIVYYANYLKFAERARTEWLRGMGLEQQPLLQSGIGFVVTRVEADFKAPARLDDLLTIESEILDIRKVRLTMRQCILRAEKTLVEMKVGLACVGSGGRPLPLPRELVNG